MGTRSGKIARVTVAAGLFATSSLAFAQQYPPQQQQPYPQQNSQQNQYPPEPPPEASQQNAGPNDQGYPQGPGPNEQDQYNNGRQNGPGQRQGPPQGGQSQYAPPASVPPQLTLRPGTFVTVRVNQVLSSDRNQAGDAFSASLVRPLVVDGVVVAQTGQMIAGRVAEAKKAGRVEGTSRLGLQLTDLTLVDGQQVPIQSQIVDRNGRTSVGRDAGAIAGTTALGAAAGAAADWGRGAAIGAGAGALVGTLGVLLTRGQPTIVHPEQVLTFRIEAPVTIATDRSPQAFRYVDPARL